MKDCADYSYLDFFFDPDMVHKIWKDGTRRCACFNCAAGDKIQINFEDDGLSNAIVITLIRAWVNCHIFQQMLHGWSIFGMPFFYCLAWLLILQWHVRINALNLFLSRSGIPVYPLKYSLKILGLNLVVIFQYFGAPMTRILPGRMP